MLGRVNVAHGRVDIGVIHDLLNVRQVRAVCRCACAEPVPPGDVKPDVPQFCIFQGAACFLAACGELSAILDFNQFVLRPFISGTALALTLRWPRRSR